MNWLVFKLGNTNAALLNSRVSTQILPIFVNGLKPKWIFNIFDFISLLNKTKWFNVLSFMLMFNVCVCIEQHHKLKVNKYKSFSLCVLCVPLSSGITRFLYRDMRWRKTRLRWTHFCRHHVTPWLGYNCFSAITEHLKSANHPRCAILL